MCAHCGICHSSTDSRLWYVALTSEAKKKWKRSCKSLRFVMQPHLLNSKPWCTFSHIVFSSYSNASAFLTLGSNPYIKPRKAPTSAPLLWAKWSFIFSLVWFWLDALGAGCNLQPGPLMSSNMCRKLQRNEITSCFLPLCYNIPQLPIQDEDFRGNVSVRVFRADHET